MSRPRVNASSEERDGQRGFLSVPTEMYADREIGARNFRRRSIRDRLGGNVEHFSFSRQNNGKRWVSVFRIRVLWFLFFLNQMNNSSNSLGQSESIPPISEDVAWRSALLDSDIEQYCFASGPL
jgi:hypothetical protein